MGLFELVGGFVAIVAIGVGTHDLWHYYGPTGVWSVSHKLEQSADWAHDHHVGKFKPSDVRLFDNSTRLLTDEECDFLIELTQKSHDYNGYARLRGITDAEYAKLEKATERVIDYMNKFSGQKDVIDHLALRRTPRAGVKAHADNVHWEPSNSTWVPNGSGHRTWSSTTMLSRSDEYEGGTFRFHEPHREDHRPGKGQTVLFEASEKNVHSVDTVPTGERYTLL